MSCAISRDMSGVGGCMTNWYAFYKQVIRVEEYKRPRQIIRIHEAPAPAPEIIRVQVTQKTTILIF